MGGEVMVQQIMKRDGRLVDFDASKIEKAIRKAMNAIGSSEISDCNKLAKLVEAEIESKFSDKLPDVESVQDIVERTLMDKGYSEVAKEYILYRAKRSKVREMSTGLMRIYDEINSVDASESDCKRENANVDGNTPMGIMLKFGSEGAKDYFAKYILTPEQAKAHSSGDIHIHDFDFYTLTETCCQIDIEKLFKDGFCTGHGFLREPNDIRTYSALACIAIQANQNDQHGGQSIPNFDYGMQAGIVKTYRKNYIKNFFKAYKLLVDGSLTNEEIKATIRGIVEKEGASPCLAGDEKYDHLERQAFKDIQDESFAKVKKFATEYSEKETDNDCYQSMEAFVHNLNTMHSRAGAQVPFSSINFGLDTSPEGRMVIKNFLLAVEAGLGCGETPIFPISIFRVKEGINYNPGDPNYDLFKLAIRVSAKRLFPNFSFIDAPYNLKYYKEGHPETEVAYMGCRTRVLANAYDPTREISFGRGNLSFTTINLPRMAINSKKDLGKFYEDLESKLNLVTDQLLDRLAIQSKKKVKNYPFLMGQGVWLDSDKLGSEDVIGEVLKHGTLSVGFIGLAEALIALTGKHHGESEEAQKLGLEIIGFMRKYLDDLAQKMKLNFTLLATPAEGTSGRFTELDKQTFGVIPRITDKEYYTNSFHIPVSYKVNAFDKIKLEAPYHALTNAGHITYVELDGDTNNNLDAFEKIIRCMKDSGVGYGSINHPVDRDPVCGYNGIIGKACPKCKREEGAEGVKFERIRRITGYLVGTLERFNDAKRAEERDRVKHGV